MRGGVFPCHYDPFKNSNLSEDGGVGGGGITEWKLLPWTWTMSLVFVLGPLPDLSIPLWKQPTAASPFILQMWPRWPTLTKEQPTTVGFYVHNSLQNLWLVKVCFYILVCNVYRPVTSLQPVDTRHQTDSCLLVEVTVVPWTMRIIF